MKLNYSVYIILIVLGLMPWPPLCYAQKNTYSLYLIGDAGLTKVADNGLKELLRSNFNAGVPSGFIFLGDNVYPSGMPLEKGKEKDEAGAILLAQIGLVKEFNSSVYFIPGNHDWERGRQNGWQRIKQQQLYIDSLHVPQYHFFPQGGCPGPVELQLNAQLVLVIIDSQWFLHKHARPQGDSSACEIKKQEDLSARLHEIFQRNKARRIIVAAHHPIFTYSQHGGVFTLGNHLFPLRDLNKKLYIPLPVIGSFYPLYRKIFGHIQDTKHPVNTHYRKMILDVIEQYPGVVFASGHDHALQHMVKDKIHYVVSGSGVKSSFARKKGYADYVSKSHGFIRIDVSDDGTASIKIFEVNRSTATFTTELLQQ